MAANDGFISYNHDALHQTVQEMFNINAQITQQMEDLENQVKQNQQLFLTQNTAPMYEAAARQIANDLTQSTADLHTTAGNVQDGSDALQAQDKKLASLFN